MRYLFKNKFRDRKNTFSKFWYEIVETRFVLCIVILLFSLLTTNTPHLQYIFAATTVYAAVNLFYGFWKSSKLQLKRIRAIPALVDVIFISFLIYFTGGQDSPWFLLYLFPIISISRYLSYEGSLPLMALTIFSYIFVAHASSQSVVYSSLILKCLVFLGIALVSGNLSRAGLRKEESLLEIFKEIDDAILNNSETNQVLRLILKKALEFTRSDFGQMKILSAEHDSAQTISLTTDTQSHERSIDALTERYCESVINSKKSLSILAIRSCKEKSRAPSQDIQENREHAYVLKTNIEDPANPACSALFVPLILNEKVRAVIALYSKNSFHYPPTEATKLESFTQLLGITLKNSEMYQEIADSESEKKERLKMLYEIGEQLKVEQGLKDIFPKVTDLTYSRLNSEESALFILDEDNNLIKKVAVRGPNKAITEKLMEIEKPYRIGESLIGKIFRDKKLMMLNPVPSDVQYHSDYSETLPSKKVRHYIGVPLIIGEEVLGVIRVINKKVANYSVENDMYEISKDGFNEEDVELLQTIASQVASAIRSAKFIEIQRYYQELIENSPDPIIVLDRKGMVIVFNKACEKIWGYNAGEVINTYVANYYATERYAKDIARLLDQTPTNRIQGYPAEIKTRIGEIIPISLSASFLYNKQGDKVGSIGVFKDLRETLKLQEEKTNAEKLATLGKLAHTVGHEIKHDIATALNYIDTLAYECTDDEELSEIYRDIQEALGEAVDKFQNMLMIGRPKPPEKMLISAEDIIRRVEASLRVRANSKQIEFIINYPESNPELEADIEQIRQVLANLFDNSIDAITAKKSTMNRGRIILTAEARNGDLHITWQDNGCGIPIQSLPKMFTPFITSKPTGNGLGLFIIKNIIENHGGNISVESKEGEGTVFKLTLPISKETESAN